MKTFICSIILLFLCASFLQAQPDIKYGLYLNNKKCFIYENKFTYFDFLCTSTHSIYAISGSDGLNSDVYLSKLNASFDTLWTIQFGGSEHDIMENILEMNNGHLLLCGTTSSEDGDVWYGHSYSAKEIWVVEVDTMGHIVKGKTFGGGNGSDLDDACVASDGSIYLCGSTIANDYDFAHASSGGFLDSDGWIAKLDTAFQLKWVQFYGGNSDESCVTFQELEPNKLIFSCITASTDTVMLGNQAKGDADALIGMVDSLGGIYWKKRIGSSSGESIREAVVDKQKKVIYLIGDANVASGDISYCTGMGNVWILKMDGQGNILQSKAYGPTLKSLLVIDAFMANGFIWFTADGDNGAGGGDMEVNQNNLSNTWIGMIDSSANLVGKYTVNGEWVDLNLSNCCVTPWGIFYAGSTMGYLPNSQTCSPSTDSVARYVALLNFAPLSVSAISHSEPDVFTLSPNPSQEEFVVQLHPATPIPSSLFVYTQDGKLQYQSILTQRLSTFSCTAWPNATYIIRVVNDKQQREKLFVKY